MWFSSERALDMALVTLTQGSLRVSAVPFVCVIMSICLVNSSLGRDDLTWIAMEFVVCEVCTHLRGMPTHYDICGKKKNTRVLAVQSFLAL